MQDFWGCAKARGVKGSSGSEPVLATEAHNKSAPIQNQNGSSIDFQLRLGIIYRLEGKFTKSEKAYLKALAATEQQYGSSDLRVAESLNHLVGLYNAEKNYQMAEILARRSLSIYESVLGFDHEVTCATSLCLALLCRKQAKSSEAAIFYRNSFATKGKTTEASTIVACGLIALAQNCYKNEQFTEAEILLTYSALERNNTMWPENPRIAYALSALADSCCTKGLLQESALLYARSLDILEACLGLRHRFTLVVNERYRTVLSRLFDTPSFMVCNRKSSLVQLLFRERTSQSLKSLNEPPIRRILKGLSGQLSRNNAMLRVSRRLIDSVEDREH